MAVSKTDCIRIARAHLAESIELEVVEGWPSDLPYLTEIDSKERVWTAHVRTGDRIGASQVIIVSQDTGKVIIDTCYGE